MTSRDKAVFLTLFFISGACGLTYEIVWSRLLVFVFGGTTFASGQETPKTPDKGQNSDPSVPNWRL